MKGHIGEIISGFVGGSAMVLLTIKPDELVKAVLMALIGGAIGAFAKGAGTHFWEWTQLRFKKKKDKEDESGT